MSHKVGEKFIIEIDSVMTNAKGTLYGVRGFKSLVFDDRGLDILIKQQKETIEEEKRKAQIFRELFGGMF